MKMRGRLVAAAMAITLTTGPAAAGLLDAPPPTLDGGTPGTVVYRMGAVHYEPGGWVDTSVTCTNLSSAPAVIALEVFDENDRLAGELAKATASAGAKVSFATSESADVPGAVVVPRLPAVDHGKARISASTTQLACTAVNRVRGSDGTTKEAALELIKKVAY
jgi:hypothetical protein